MGIDAEVEFSTDLAEAIKAAEERFPAPEFAVVFADADGESEDDIDQIIVCRRVSGVMMPMVYVGLDELEEYTAGSFDWIGSIASDLARTEADIEAFIAADKAGEATEETTGA